MTKKLTEAQIRRDSEALYQEYLRGGYSPFEASRLVAREVREALAVDMDALMAEAAAIGGGLPNPIPDDWPL